MNLEVEKSYAGFKLVEQKTIEEINSTGRVFEHEKTGARLFHIENDDDNKVFCISFRTPPEDHTGLPHILEHSVLCGSRKYPLKDPFVELAKGSLNTFLNAMTYPDKTMYPVASRNDQDFKNLMDVYLDAVFYPNIYKHHEILKQEGWHHDLDNQEGEVTYKGVVYNEMKGAFSSPEQILFRNIQQTLFPDTPYAFESGGDPEFIPDLTQEQFEAFHSKYYHPSNSYIYLYGNMDILDNLTYLDKEYLSEFDPIDINSELPIQEPFKEPSREVINYSIASNETEKDKTFLSYNIVIGNGDQPEVHYTLDILEHILLETPGAPLKEALLQAGIGKDIFGSADTAIKQPALSIVAKGTNPEDEEKFLQVIRDTLKKLVEEGIDKKEIEAAINLFEFKLREADYGRYPKGLMYGIISMSSWLYDEDPMMLIQYNPIFEKIKTALTSDYLERFMQEHLLNNTHASVLVVKPEKGLNAVKEKEVKDKLVSYKESLSEEDIKQLVNETNHLRQYQEEPSPKEDIEKIPLLQLEDINRDAEKLELNVEAFEDITLLYHEDFTNLVGYVNMYFDLNRLDKELMPYAGLLANLLGKINTEKLSYGQLSNEINIHTGGINFSTTAYGINAQPDGFDAKMVVTSKAFYDKLPQLFELLNDMINGTQIDDDKRLKEVISETKSRLQMNMTSSGHNVAAMRAQSYFSPSYACKDLLQGVGYYQFLAEIESDYDCKKDAIKDNLRIVKDLIFNQSTLTVGYTGEEKSLEAFNSELTAFLKTLRKIEEMPVDLHFDLINKNEGLMTSDKIQYVAKAGNYITTGHEYKGTIPVMKTILSLEYLWGRVRVMGGAYGCMTNFTRSGNVFFVSYRDPNLKETLQAYDEVYNFIKEFDCDDREMLKYIIGTISRIDAPLTPSMKGSTAMDNYFMKISHEDIQQTRDEILDTRPIEIRSLADLVKDALASEYICVQGNEDKIKANEEIFNQIIQLFA
ncbi:insulinase family protein [Vallitalea okinawensis]|uniref:insulinase family protein n=1 Tax=Vallitalea okinawensis TaxID=2078660 RepID=UPI000CFAFCFC|nr:insulinase family protein [Vallitalea okinawensis]